LRRGAAGAARSADHAAANSETRNRHDPLPHAADEHHHLHGELRDLVKLITEYVEEAETNLAAHPTATVVESIQASAADVKAGIDAIGDDIRGVKDTIAGFVHDPLDAALHGILVPAAQSLLGGLRRKKDPE
jgi:hypothetical protein